MTSREEIVLALKYFFDVETEASVHEIIGQDDDPLGTIAAALDEYRKVDSCEGWIKCLERMPDTDDFVCVWPLPDFGVELHVGQYLKCHKKGAGWYAQINEQNYGIEWHPITVTHWQPLPEPPKESE